MQGLFIRHLAEKDRHPVRDNVFLPIWAWDENPEVTTAGNVVDPFSYLNPEFFSIKGQLVKRRLDNLPGFRQCVEALICNVYQGRCGTKIEPLSYRYRNVPATLSSCDAFVGNRLPISFLR
jgi:hypothetical protein